MLDLWIRYLKSILHVTSIYGQSQYVLLKSRLKPNNCPNENSVTLFDTLYRVNERLKKHKNDRDKIKTIWLGCLRKRPEGHLWSKVSSSARRPQGDACARIFCTLCIMNQDGPGHLVILSSNRCYFVLCRISDSNQQVESTSSIHSLIIKTIL